MSSAPSREPAPKAAAAPAEGRFYEAEYPELDDIVVVQIRRIVDLGAYATLLEYNGKEGMMLSNELSKYRTGAMNKTLKIGRRAICTTLRVDKEKGYIDLSKRRVEPERVRAKEEAFAKAKAVHSIMRRVASVNNVEVEEVCKKVSWPLFRRHQDAFEALKRHISGEIDLWEELDFSRPGRDLTPIAGKVKAEIEACLRRRLLQQAFRLRAKVEVSCEGYEGIDAVRRALSKGLELSKQDCQLKITLLAHPVFVLSCTCQERATGVAAIDAATALIERSIRADGGWFRLRSHPDLSAEDLEVDGSSEDERSAPQVRMGMHAELDEDDSDADAEEDEETEEEEGEEEEEEEGEADEEEEAAAEPQPGRRVEDVRRPPGKGADDGVT